VFDEVNRYNEENYASFSRLLRTTFDDAQHNFGDGTVDLLHIDGLHTYDAVRHDFDTWFPKVRPGGVVLIHDIAARHVDFQVWKLWEELAPQFPHLEFTHSWGLGVLRKPGGPAGDPEFVQTVFSASRPEQSFLRHYYASQAEVLERAPLVARASSPAETVFQVFPNLESGYSEASSDATVLKLGEWQRVVLKIPHGSGTGRIRVDPADRPCVIELADVVLRRTVDGSVLKSWTDAAGIRECTPIADLVWLPGNDASRLLSTGSDPQLLLPEVDPALAEQSLVFEARVRIDQDVAPALALIQSAAETAERAQRDQALMRNQQLSAEIRNLQAERVAVVADYRRVHAINESLQGRLASEQERWLREQTKLEAELKVVYQSRSWWLTAPLRRLFRAIR
jgi:hypothetical protein